MELPNENGADGGKDASAEDGAAIDALTIDDIADLSHDDELRGDLLATNQDLASDGAVPSDLALVDVDLLPDLDTTKPDLIPPDEPSVVSYQIDVAHTGAQADSAMPPSLSRRWSINLGAKITYPLIANGAVFVAQDGNLYSFALNSGANLWGPVALGSQYGWAAIAYDNRKVFTANTAGVIAAYTSSRGRLIWSTQIGPSDVFESSPPVATGGTVFVARGPAYYALSEVDGTVLWSTALGGLDTGMMPAVGSAVFGSGGLCATFALDLGTGAQIWRHDFGCTGAGPFVPALAEQKLWIRNTQDTVLDPVTGDAIGPFALAARIPAFHSGTGFFLSGQNVLSAIDIASSSVKWSFVGDGNLSTAPIVVSGSVYVGSTGGNLYSLDETTGGVIWSDAVGSSIPVPYEQGVPTPITGLAAGAGALVVPTASGLVVY